MRSSVAFATSNSPPDTKFTPRASQIKLKKLSTRLIGNVSTLLRISRQIAILNPTEPAIPSAWSAIRVGKAQSDKDSRTQVATVPPSSHISSSIEDPVSAIPLLIDYQTPL